MTGWSAAVAWVWFELTVSAGLWFGGIALLMVVTRQPSRRSLIAKCGILGGLLILPCLTLSAVLPLDEWLTKGFRFLGFDASRFGPLGRRDSAAWQVIERWTTAWGGRCELSVVPQWLMVAYFARVGAGLCGIVLGAVGVGWLLGRSRPPSAALNAVYQQLPYRGRRPVLRVLASADRPAAVGWVRPTVLVPLAFERRLTLGQLRAVLRHELAHAAHRDPLVQLGARIVQTVWFFLPHVRWIGWQSRLDQEYVCDDIGAGSEAFRWRYAEALVAVAASGQPSPQRPIRPRVGQVSVLQRRVAMLLDRPFLFERSAPRWLRGVCGVLLLGVPLLVVVSRGLAEMVVAREQPDNRTRRTTTEFRLDRVGFQPSPFPVELALPIAALDAYRLEATLVLPPASSLEGVELAGWRFESWPEIADGVELQICLDRRQSALARLTIDGQTVGATETVRPVGGRWSIRVPPGRRLEIRDLRLSR